MKSHQRPLAIAIVLGVLLACLAGLCGYQCLASAAAASAITEQRAKLASTIEQAEALSKAQADAKHLTIEIAQHHAPWSWSEELPVMVTQISGIVAGCGTVIDTLQPAPVMEREQVSRYPLHLTLHMHVTELTKFLQHVQQAIPLLAVDQLNIRAGKKPGDPLLVDITISSYVMLDEKQAGRGRS